jgi:hypothetical protein
LIGSRAQDKGRDYTNDSEYIRDLIRREQERGAQIEMIRFALIEGEKSGNKALRSPPSATWKASRSFASFTIEWMLPHHL